ncbi:MAG TPA: hypothetical protein PKW79_00020 [Rhabdochlamydiaceae bacterium]|nr:hypothetical protein [Rhabdochlamydiaceae bacterium]
MVEVKKFKISHLEDLLREPQNEYLVGYLKYENLETMEKNGLNYSIFCVETKQVLFCGGVSEYWKGRGECWAVFHHNVRSKFVQIHRCVLRYFEMCPIKRIEATVKYDFKEGHRWIKALGFTLEAPRLRFYYPNGDDVSLYSRVKED